jgi:hypothetical protein
VDLDAAVGELNNLGSAAGRLRREVAEFRAREGSPRGRLPDGDLDAAEGSRRLVDRLVVKLHAIAR